MMNTESLAEIPSNPGTRQWYQLQPLLFPTVLFVSRDLSICEKIPSETWNRNEVAIQGNEEGSVDVHCREKHKQWTGGKTAGARLIDTMNSLLLSDPHWAPVSSHYFKGFTFTLWSTWIL